MNKSTPLNQLPNNPMMQNTFVNDQQRQIVTNAQQAIGNINMPQNTQVQPDFGDDDAEIQEALNDVNAQLQPQPPPQRMQTPPPQMMQMPQEYNQEVLPHQMIPNIPIENQSDLMFMQGARAMAHPQQMLAPAPQKKDWFNMSDFFERFADDVKLAVIIAIVVAAVHFIPFSSLIGKYIAVEKIPYHDIILRAVFAAVVIVAVKNLVF